MDFPRRIPFAESLGFELVRFETDEAEIAVPIGDGLTNGWGVAHGGVTMTLLDVVMAHAARSPGGGGDDTDRGVVTIEMKTSFIRPGLGRLVGVGRRLYRATSIAFCEGSVRDESGALVAHGTGTFKYMRGLPAGGRRIQRADAPDRP